MLPEPAKRPSRFILISKWGGCFTALVFAVSGLLCDLAWPGDAFGSLGRGSWVVVAVSMAFGLIGVVLDRPHDLPKSSDPTLTHRS
jgi:hypothetical protein